MMDWSLQAEHFKLGALPKHFSGAERLYGLSSGFRSGRGAVDGRHCLVIMPVVSHNQKRKNGWAAGANPARGAPGGKDGW